MNSADESIVIVDEHNRVVGRRYSPRGADKKTDSPQHLYPGFQLCQSTLPAQTLEQQRHVSGELRSGGQGSSLGRREL
jgi:hypothetical protein